MFEPPNPDQTAAIRLNELLSSAGQPELNQESVTRFQAYLALLMRWNARLNLTSIRNEEGILSRHFVESIICARIVPDSVATLLDFGSGAGLPGIPIALCRPEICVTLAESQAKKAAFLQEAARTLTLSSKIFAGRAEKLTDTYDCVAMRAVDRMERAVSMASRLVSRGGWLILMTTLAEMSILKAAAGDHFEWIQTVPLPGSKERRITVGRST